MLREMQWRLSGCRQRRHFNSNKTDTCSSAGQTHSLTTLCAINKANRCLECPMSHAAWSRLCYSFSHTDCAFASTATVCIYPARFIHLTHTPHAKFYVCVDTSCCSMGVATAHLWRFSWQIYRRWITQLGKAISMPILTRGVKTKWAWD